MMFDTLLPDRKNVSTSGNIPYPTASASKTTNLLAETDNIRLLGNSLRNTTLNLKNHLAGCSCQGCRSLLINLYPIEAAPVVGVTVQVASLPLLSSNPTATSKMFLDFNGHTTSGTTWNISFNGGANIVTPAYSIDADTTTFSTTEVARIEEIWKRVAEDYAPFNIDVTTIDPGNLNAANNIRVVIGGAWDQWFEESGGVGGIAYLTSWQWNNDTPVFVFEDNLANGAAKFTAEAISHEAGHSLGLNHQSTYNALGNQTAQYNSGFGSGPTGWAPIMGVNYYQNLTTWHNGTSSLGATSYQDDMSIISAANNGFGGYRTDDHGNTISSATALSGTTTLTGSGIITQTSDIDVFSFPAGAGPLNFTINPAQDGPNLDILAELINSSGNIIASSNLSSNLFANLNTSVSPGIYFLLIKSNGEYGRVGQYTISGTVAPADTTPPTASSFSPADNATGVAVGANLVINFSEAIQKGSGNLFIKKQSNNSVVETIAVTALNVTVSGSQLTINPTANLAPGTDYYVQIPNGAIKDNAGNNYAGITGNSAWNFKTVAPADTTPPTASSFSPADNATGVAVGANLVINFSEAIQKGSGNLFIKKQSNNSVVETIAVTALNVTVSGSQLTINPTANLAPGTDYYVQIPNGAIKDNAGNNYAGITGNSAWNFKTVVPADTTPPIASSFSPTDNATGVVVGANLVMSFSEAIQKGSGNLIIKKLSDNSVVETIAVAAANVTVSGSQLTINPTANLGEGTDYYVEIPNGVIKDNAGNNYAGITGNSTWNFTTVAPADTAPPTASSFSPTDNATGVAVGANLVINFSEPIQPGTGNLVIKKQSDNSVVETIAVTALNVTVSGSQLTINPTGNLGEGTDYYVEIPNGVIKDNAGNNYAGITGNSTWNFTTVAPADTAPPTASSFSPTDNATGVVVGANLVINFSEPIQPGTGNLVIKKQSDNSVVETIAVAAANVTVSGSQLTIDPTANLGEGTDYYVEIPNGVIKDNAGNNYAGITGNSTWNFTTVAPADTAPPTASSFSPTDNATGVAIGGNLVINFSEPIQPGTGNLVIKKQSDNSVVETIAVTALNVTVSGSQLTIDPTANLGEGTDYYVEIPNGVIKDNAGNNYAGITGNSTWNFTTVAPADTAPPTASSFSPTDNATGVAVGANLVINFSEPIQPGTGNLVIKKQSDNSVVETIAVAAANVTVSGSQLTIDPTANLGEGTDYYVEIPNGVIKDNAGNNYAGITGNSTWNFTTVAPADTAPPTASSFSPTDNATGVAVGANLVINFSEPIQPGTGNLVIKKQSDNSVVETIAVAAANVTVSGSQLTIDPTANLGEGTDYYVEIPNGVIKDNAGNNYAGITGNSTWNFTTVAPADTAPPTASSFSPADNATGVAVGANLVINFSEPIQPGTGNLVIKKQSDNSVVETIAVAAANVTVSGSQLTIDPTANLGEGTDYYVEIPNGVIKDNAGNNYAGITGNSTWNFTTVAPADTAPPTASSFSPTDNATGVAVGANLVINFSEPIQPGTGNLVIKKQSDNSVVETIAVAAANVTVSGSQLTINPTANLGEGTDYYVEIPNGVIKDNAGNNYAGITGNSTWNFTTVAPADTAPPTASSFSPTDNATGVAVGANLVINFSEPIQPGTGNLVIKKQSDNSVVETIAVAAANVTVSGSQLTINPTANLGEGTDYYVEIPNGVIKDNAGNNYAGITGNSTWNFTTQGTAVINGTAGADNLTGTAKADIVNGLAGNETLHGGAGNDSLDGGNHQDILDGGLGNDKLKGGLGDDIYVADSVGDVVTELADQGTDLVQPAVTYTLPAEVENLTLTGTTGIKDTDNYLANTITGNTANNKLNGGASEDILTGDTGADTFMFQFGQSSVSASDRVTDFAIDSDKIDDLLTQGGVAMNPSSLFSRAANRFATTLQNVVTQVFTDANGSLAGNQALGINSGALVVATTGSIACTYLVINDGTAGFQPSNDLVLNLTEHIRTLPPLGNISDRSFFI